MKNNIIKYTLIAAALISLNACKDKETVYADPDIIDVNTIDSIGLIPSHTMLVANGKNIIEFTPVAYTKIDATTKKRLKIYGPRVKDEWFDYTTSIAGAKMSRYFSTSDKALAGQSFTVSIKLKGKKLTSNTVTFNVVAPLEVTQTYTMPVVFHIIQTQEDIDSYGGSYGKDRIDQIITKLNRTFAGEISTNPTGINTKIIFKPALYGPTGNKLIEPGINRKTVKTIVFDNANPDGATDQEKQGDLGYNNMITDNKLNWPGKKYLNIWLISDRANNGKTFGKKYSKKCNPKFIAAGTTGAPGGLDLTSEPKEGALDLPDANGLLYRLQAINQIRRYTGSIEAPEDNDIVHYLGGYLGLLPTSFFVLNEEYDAPVPEDYCSDTQQYLYKQDGYNATQYKETKDITFLGENIMDDPTGAHRSITQEQYKRIKWVLENCIDRTAWKSNFAFTGK